MYIMLNTTFVCEMFSFDAVLYFFVINNNNNNKQFIFTLVFFISLPYQIFLIIRLPSVRFRSDNGNSTVCVCVCYRHTHTHTRLQALYIR